MKKLLILVFLLGILLAAAGWWVTAPRKVSVSVSIFTFATVKKGALTETVSATGRLQPIETIIVASETPGLVVQVLGDVNQMVGPNDVLVKLDAELAQLKVKQADDGIETAKAAVARAAAAKKAAKLALQRQKDLEKQGGFRSQKDKANAELEAATASVTMAKAKLRAAKTQKQLAEFEEKRTLVRVPVKKRNGMFGWTDNSENFLPPLDLLGRKREFLILNRHVQIGQMVGPQALQPLFTLAGSLGKMEIHTEVVEGDIGKLRKGLSAVFTISSYSEPDRSFRGVVREIRPLPNNLRGAVYYNAVVAVDNQKNAKTKEWRLRPGMTASVDIILRQSKNSWKIPAAALNFQMEKAYQSEETKKRLRAWKQKADWSDWRPVWIWDEKRNSVWPIFVRLGDAKANKVGIQDGEFHEILEWEHGFNPRIGLSLIISAPPAQEPGIFDQPVGLKLS